MAEHTIEIDVTSNDNDAKQVSKELNALARVASRLSPEMRSAMATLRALNGVAKTFGVSLTKLTALGVAIGAAKKTFDMLEGHFKNLADAAEQTAKAMSGMFQTANDIKAKRMKEGGVTEEERAAAAGAKEQAEGSLRALEDLMLRMEKSSVKAGGGDKGAAAAINEAMKSGLYSDIEINKLSENGNPLQALLDDISKKMQAASKDAKTWDSVLKQYNKEQEEAKKEADKSQKELIADTVEKAKEMFREGQEELDQMISDIQADLDEQKEDADYKQYQTKLSNAPIWLQEEIAGAGKTPAPETVLTAKRDSFMPSQLNSLDRLGGYTSNLVNAQASPELQEMKTQTLKLNQIAENTKKTSARFSG